MYLCHDFGLISRLLCVVICMCLLLRSHGFCFDSLPCAHCLRGSPPHRYLINYFSCHHTWLVYPSILPFVCSLVSDCCGVNATLCWWPTSSLVLPCFPRLLVRFSVYSLPSQSVSSLPLVSPVLCSPVPVLALPELCFVASPPLHPSAHSRRELPILTLHQHRRLDCGRWSLYTLPSLPRGVTGGLIGLIPVSILCLELRLPALFTGWVLCSETLINIWVELAMESVFFPDNLPWFDPWEIYLALYLYYFAIILL